MAYPIAPELLPPPPHTSKARARSLVKGDSFLRRCPEPSYHLDTRNAAFFSPENSPRTLLHRLRLAQGRTKGRVSAARSCNCFCATRNRWMRCRRFSHLHSVPRSRRTSGHKGQVYAGRVGGSSGWLVRCSSVSSVIRIQPGVSRHVAVLPRVSSSDAVSVYSSGSSSPAQTRL